MVATKQHANNRVATAMAVGGALLLLGTGVALADARGFGSAAEDPGALHDAGRSPATSAPTDPQQMLAQAHEALEVMGKAEDTIRMQLRSARESRDVVKSLCLDDKLNQIDVARRTATDRVSGLEAAVQAGDAERIRHEHAVLLALRERGDSLLQEADQCIGEEIAAMGNTQLEVTVDPNIAAADPAIPTEPLISFPPVLASPTL